MTTLLHSHMTRPLGNLADDTAEALHDAEFERRLNEALTQEEREALIVQYCNRAAIRSVLSSSKGERP